MRTTPSSRTQFLCHAQDIIDDIHDLVAVRQVSLDDIETWLADETDGKYRVCRMGPDGPLETTLDERQKVMLKSSRRTLDDISSENASHRALADQALADLATAIATLAELAKVLLPDATETPSHAQLVAAAARMQMVIESTRR